MTLEESIEILKRDLDEHFNSLSEKDKLILAENLKKAIEKNEAKK